MPKSKSGGRGRVAIYDYRVKAGKKEVFSHPRKLECEIFMREHKSEYKTKLRLIPPNF